MSSTNSFNFSLILGALLGASSILLGAYGAHGLNDIFLKLPRMETAYSKAVDYQMYHSIVLVVLGVGSFIPNINLPRYLCFSFAGSVSLFLSPFILGFWRSRMVNQLNPFGRDWICLLLVSLDQVRMD